MEKTYDLAILGGGPAGVAAGVYAARKRLNTVFITKDWQGQSSVSEGIENWIGEVKIPGLELSKKLENHLKAYAGDIFTIKEGEWVKLAEKTGNGFKITTDKGSYEARALLVTTGSSRRKLDVPGADRLEHKGLTYCASCDGPLFTGEDVVVVGGGNAGFESAAQLLAYCKSVTLLARSDFKADPVTVNAVISNPKMKAVANAVPKEVLGDKFVSGFTYTDSTNAKDVTLAVAGIFTEIGSIPNTDFIKGVIKLDQFNRIPVDAKNQRTGVAGIWAAGDVTDGLFHQNNIAVGDAVKALEDLYLFIKAQ
ncbi:MAG: FAD-dependent oxidoreductase [Candidatus Pacebacteria bacterium]|nr:FAD-dependent oxidoreductase [Candidatus Paceibacterota bacterium]